jgi:hypothetical protein
MTPKKISLEQELKIALDNRAFEIQLFWQRSNYFLVLMTALGIGTFTIKDIYLSPIIAAFAVFCSIFWFKVAVGSKFWQESWEVEVSELSDEYGVRSFKKSTDEVIAQVSKSLGSSHSGEKKSPLRRWVNKSTIKKHSVTYHMILLALCSVAVWIVVLVAFLLRLALYLCDIVDGCLRCAIPG